ncbi:MAG: prepilin-type N-terminal cleavage/methylation domain-containing protein [Candidatus Saccharibacteria bacterium]|nr:prepilin-type N-terminal cleavage/methylation domain-containing protein [Candidatus Saccharibacteria bacterium]
MKHKGFTIVELVVVLVVIAILLAIGIVSYSYMRDDGMDTKIRSVVKTVGDAVRLYESQEGRLPDGQGHFTDPRSIDTLRPQYLQQNYRDGLKSKNANGHNQIFRWYKCASGGGFAVYASLNNPTDEDKQHLNEVRSKCGQNNSHVPIAGAKPIYNYAQLF